MGDPEPPSLGPEAASALRALPQLDALLRAPGLATSLAEHPRARVVRAARAALDEARAAIRGGGRRAPFPLEALVAAAGSALAREARPGLCRAINATGVILHTGLGRAPLAPEARAALAEVAEGACVLEIDRATGERSHREAPVAALLAELCGAEAATVVNNNAAACLLMLAALCAGREVIVSRGQLVEIGGSFRIPEVMEASGAKLREVGSTNKTRLDDYERAIGPATAAILAVHRSNFRIVGFTADVPLGDLAALAHARGLWLLEDLGSGNLVDLSARGLPDEPVVASRLAQGVDVCTFSGDKLLGGPQAGVAVGRRACIEALRRHPLFRAVRPGKLTLAALEATLRIYRDEARPEERIPVLARLCQPAEALRPRAEALAGALAGVVGLAVEVVPSEAEAGSGALPAIAIPSLAVALRAGALSADRLARRLREGDPPVFPRIRGDRVLLEVRTVASEEVLLLAAAVRAALAPAPPLA